MPILLTLPTFFLLTWHIRVTYYWNTECLTTFTALLESNNQYVLLPNTSMLDDYSLQCGFGLLDIMAINR